MRAEDMAEIVSAIPPDDCVAQFHKGHSLEKVDGDIADAIFIGKVELIHKELDKMLAREEVSWSGDGSPSDWLDCPTCNG